MKDDVLVEQTLAGDHQAFNSLITDYYTDIYGMVLSWVKNPEDAKDLTQDVFISAYLDLPSLRDHKRFYSWLRQIAKHKCQNWKRKQIDFIPINNDLISKEPSTDEVLILRETLAKVMEAIDNLPESEKRLLKEHYLDDVSYDELEAKHGISTKALVVRLVRARRKIRDQLEKTLSAFVAFLHDHGKSILTGGMDIMKLSVKTKLITGGIAVMLATGGTGVLINHYYAQDSAEQISQKVHSALPAKSVSIDGKASIKKITQTKTQTNSQNSNIMNVSYKIEAPKIDSDNKNSSNGIEEKKSLSHKEQLRERINQMFKNPEFKALNDKVNMLSHEAMSLNPPETLRKQIYEYNQNTWSVFGLTKDEASQREWTKEEIEYMRKVGRDLENEQDKYEEAIRAKLEERDRISNQMLAMLGMTESEWNYALQGNESR
jgi:RNA polymerase sigma-70 factor (ECF subfamily)